MKMQTVGIRMPVGHLGMIEQAAELTSQSAGQWIRDAAIEKLRGQADGERLAGLEARLLSEFEKSNARLDNLKPALTSLRDRLIEVGALEPARL